MIKFHKYNKQGTSTVFLSIVLSLVILIECTFVTYVWSLSRALEVNRALKAQMESVFACYNRQLFDVYGIYAFTVDDIDEEIYRSCLEINGITDGEDIYILNTKTINADCIKKAISNYYMYRGSGIYMQTYGSLIINLLESLDEKGILKKIKKFTSSDASKYLQDFLEGAEEITKKLDDLGIDIDLSENNEELKFLSKLSRLVKDSKNDLKKYKSGFDITNLKFATEAINEIYDFIDGGSEFVADYGLHMFAAHYASYNFDCAVSNDSDCTLNGTAFSDIHSENYYDAEYIMTGFDGRLGFLKVSSLIFQIIFVQEFLDITSNAATMTLISAVAELISSIISAVTDGAVTLPAQIWEAVIVLIIAGCHAGQGVADVLEGGKIELLEIENVGVISLGYREFLYLYMNFVNTDQMIDRMRSVLKRDYGDILRGVSLGTSYLGQEYQVKKVYALYG